MSTQTDFKDLHPLSDEDIAEIGIMLSDLWMLKANEQMYGPFSTKTLKEHSEQHEESYLDVVAYNLDNEQWKPFFKVTQFQRRKPKLVSMQSLTTPDSFHLLINGIKEGPFTLVQIKEMAQKKKIPLNIEASTDKGESWIKLFDHHEFDRRLEKNKDELPFAPIQSVFDEETVKIKKELLSSACAKAKEEEDAIVGIAFIGHGNDKGQKIKTFPHVDSKSTGAKHKSYSDKNKIIATYNETKFNLKNSAIAVVGIFVLFTVINSFNGSYTNSDEDIKLHKSTKAKKHQPVVTEQKPERKPAKVIRAKKFKPVKRKVTPKPVPKAKRYQELHVDERYETVDLDDPYVKEELTRQLAGGYGDDELSPEELEFIEKAERDGLTEEDIQRLEDMDESRYDEVQGFE